MVFFVLVHLSLILRLPSFFHLPVSIVATVEQSSRAWRYVTLGGYRVLYLPKYTFYIKYLNNCFHCCQSLLKPLSKRFFSATIVYFLCCRICCHCCHRFFDFVVRALLCCQSFIRSLSSVFVIYTYRIR